MEFWKLEQPDYESDYQQVYINGFVEHPFSLPGIECDTCGQTWGGSRILPYECPLNMRNDRNIREAWPVSLEQHKVLQIKILEGLKAQGISISELLPGDAFQPCYLDIPSEPTADFLWASLGSLVVSEKIKRVLMKHCPGDISCCDVVPRKIGKGKPKSPPPAPSTGEPEDIINEVPLKTLDSYSKPYFEICIKKESGWPSGGEPAKICPGCKRPEINESKRILRMVDEMWREDQIFFLAGTLNVIITDNLKKLIENLRPTNVIFSRV